MPITKSGFLDPLDTRQIREGVWKVLRELRYDSVLAQARLVVPVDFLTDLYSAPRTPWASWVIRDQMQAPAVLHDFLYQTHAVPRQDIADDILAEAMEAEGIAAWRRGIIWTAVRVGGASAWESGPSRYTILNEDPKRDKYRRD